MKKITLICNAGMSTSLLVNKMNDVAKKLSIDVEIRAIPEGTLKDYENDTDVLMLSPQVSFKLKKYQEKFIDSDVKVILINNLDYGMMNGENVLKQAMDL